VTENCWLSWPAVLLKLSINSFTPFSPINHLNPASSPLFKLLVTS
jgi:hypothetical protein